MKYSWVLKNEQKISRNSNINFLCFFFFFFQISSSGLIKGSLILLPASAFILLQFVLVEAHERKPASLSICNWTKEDYFNSLSMKVWMFFFKTAPNSTSGSFNLKVRYNVKSETMSMKLSYSVQ